MIVISPRWALQDFPITPGATWRVCPYFWGGTSPKALGHWSNIPSTRSKSLFDWKLTEKKNQIKLNLQENYIKIWIKVWFKTQNNWQTAERMTKFDCYSANFMPLLPKVLYKLGLKYRHNGTLPYIKINVESVKTSYNK